MKGKSERIRLKRLKRFVKMEEVGGGVGSGSCCCRWEVDGMVDKRWFGRGNEKASDQGQDDLVCIRGRKNLPMSVFSSVVDLLSRSGVARSLGRLCPPEFFICQIKFGPRYYTVFNASSFPIRLCCPLGVTLQNVLKLFEQCAQSL